MSDQQDNNQPTIELVSHNHSDQEITIMGITVTLGAIQNPILRKILETRYFLPGDNTVWDDHSRTHSRTYSEYSRTYSDRYSEHVHNRHSRAWYEDDCMP